MGAQRSLTFVILVATTVALLAAGTAGAQEAYCSITSVEAKALSNGATVTVQADGMLQYDVDSWGKVTEIEIDLENARSSLERDLIRPENAYPISFISFTIPPNARNGIGLEMRIQLVDACEFTIPEQTDPTKLVINIKTERTVPQVRPGATAAAAPEAQAAAGVEGSVEVTFEEGLLTVRALKADLHRVVAEIARASGVNVAVDDRVRRKVSVHVSGLNADQVLQGIASGYGLAISTVGDVKMVSEGIPTDLPTYGRSATQSYPLTYLQVDDAASLLPPFLIEYLRRNPQQNSIVVTAPRQMLEKIGRDLRAIDIAPPLIMVEVLAVEMTRDGSGESFLEWAYYGDDWQASSDSFEGEARYSEGNAYGVAGGVVDTETLSAHVRALLTSGTARIHAQPRMAAMNGERATIFIGRDKFIKMTYIRYGQQQERIETVRVGVSLTVTPWTGGNGEITSNIQCEVSNIVDIDPETGIPRLSTRRAEANVRARDGETIIIGGLLQKQNETVRRRIPILSEIPLIGDLFESTRQRSTDTELVFFVTPRVIDPDSAAALAAEAAAGATAVFTCPAPPYVDVLMEPAPE
ncbi:MAG: type II secretion system protein GspD [Armatimonadota bacterium]